MTMMATVISLKCFDAGWFKKKTTSSQYNAGPFVIKYKDSCNHPFCLPAPSVFPLTMYHDQSSLICFNHLLFAKLAKSKEDDRNKKVLFFKWAQLQIMQLHVFQRVLLSREWVKKRFLNDILYLKRTVSIHIWITLFLSIVYNWQQLFYSRFFCVFA